MMYDMLPYETVKRVWGTFQAHSACINKKYEQFKGKDTYWSSDRDRFVGRFFRKHVGKCIAFTDKLVRGYKSEYDGHAFYSSCSPKSVYSAEYSRSWGVNGEPLFMSQKRYLCITGFQAVNELYGLGYIEMSCLDERGGDFKVRLDHNNLLRIQFKEISEAEYSGVMRLFEDDRDDRPYKVKRYFVNKEVKERKVKGQVVQKVKEHVVTEEVEVMAKDIDEARKMLPNTISVERI